VAAERLTRHTILRTICKERPSPRWPHRWFSSGLDWAQGVRLILKDKRGENVRRHSSSRPRTLDTEGSLWTAFFARTVHTGKAY